MNRIFLSGVLLTLSSFCAKADTFTYTTNTLAGETVNASAFFTTGANSITISLKNLLTAAQVHDEGQNISDIIFTISDTFNGTVSDSNRSYTGTLVNVASGGTHAVTVASGTHNGWDFSNNHNVFTLEELGSAQGNNQTIIGGAGASSYSGANASITNGSHDPFIQGEADFTLNVAGVTSNTRITAVTFSFGSDLGSNSAGTLQTSPVPETSSLLMLGTVSLILLPLLRRIRA